MNSLLLNATSLLLQANEVLSNYAVPVIAGIIVISVAIAIFTNLDGIVDRDGTGTRKGAIMNVVWVVLYVIIGIAVLAGIVRLVGSMSLSI